MFMQETPRNLFRTSHLPDGTSSSLPCVDAWDVPKESATEGAIQTTRKLRTTDPRKERTTGNTTIAEFRASSAPSMLPMYCSQPRNRYIMQVQ